MQYGEEKKLILSYSEKGVYLFVKRNTLICTMLKAMSLYCPFEKRITYIIGRERRRLDGLEPEPLYGYHCTKQAVSCAENRNATIPYM